MKFIKFILVIGLSLLLASCASNENPMAAFKNKTAAQILSGGKQLLAKGSYSDAIVNFEALDALYPFGNEAKQGQISIIYAYYKNGDFAPAVAAADRYAHLYPRDEKVAYTYYMKGIINLESGLNWLQKMYHSEQSKLDLKSLRVAFSNFNELVQQYPNSIYANDARNRMIYIRNALADHEVTVADFYLSHKAYVAAINRANYLVKHLQGAPAMARALQIMAEGYKALGETEKANDTLRILKINYPKS